MKSVAQTKTARIQAELEQVGRIFEDGFRPPPRPEAKKRPRWRRRKQDCLDCGVDTSFDTGVGHYFTLRDDVWLTAVPGGERVRLCIDCCEARLKRKLVPDDFVRTPAEIMASFAGKDDFVEASLRARGRDDLADQAAHARRQDKEWRAEAEKHWQEIRAQHPEWEADR